MVWIRIIRLDKELPLPKYETEDSAAVDFYSRLDIEIKPGKTKLIPSGIRVAIPSGYELQLRPRSGLALKHGITLLNTPGTIDADYRGEIGIIAYNSSSKPFSVKRGDRICQAALNKVELIQWKEVEALDETQRDIRAFGSTGLKSGEQ